MPIVTPTPSGGKVLPVAVKFTVDENQKELQAAVEKHKNTILTMNQLGERVRQAERKHLEDTRKAEDERIKQEIRKAELQQQQIDMLKQEAILLRRNSRVMKDVAGDIAEVAAPLAAIGSALTGGVLLAANRYIATTKEVNEVTDRWHRATTRVREAQDRIGKVAAEQLLPYYEKAAQLAERVASFVERNPGAIDAALKVGVITSGLGALGLAVSKGIRWVADNKIEEAAEKMLLAAQLMSGAADKNLAAAGGGGGLPSLSKKLNTPLGIAGTVGVGVASATVVSGLIDKIQDLLNERRAGAGDAARNLVNQPLTNAIPILGVIENIKKMFPALQKLSDDKIGGLIDSLTGAGDASEEAARKLDTLAKVAGSANEKAVVDAYTKMIEEEKRITEESAAERVRIVQEAAAKEKAAYESNLAAIQRINSQTSARIAELNRNFQLQEKQSFEDYLVERSDIAREGGEEIARIEQDLQERLRKLRLDHEDKMAELTASRDALGIVKEQRAFARARKEEEREASLEIRQRRRDIALRLNDLARSYDIERQRRLDNYQAQVAEAHAQRAEQLKAQQAHYQAELAEIRKAKAQQLKELEEQKKREIQSNRAAFISYIRQLDASLLGESQLRQRYYDQMLADADRWLAEYRRRLDLSSSSSTSARVPGKATGGYTKGLVNTGENGWEFILNNRITKLVERMVGGEITEDKLMKLLLANGQGNKTINISDNRRFQNAPSVWERNRMNKEIQTTLEGLLS